MLESIINIAKGELGQKEGYNNDTKYGIWYKMNYQPWCAMFVSWCADRALIPTSIIPKHAACLVGANWFKERSRWYTTPQRGDIVFFYVSGSINHEGIVTAVTNSQITTIEGNTSDMVASRTYSRSNSSIAGYGRPNYSIKTSTDSNGCPFGTSTLTVQNGSEGVHVSRCQWYLQQYGISVGSAGIDGKCGPDTVSAIKTFQSRYGLTVDGICGSSTWAALVNNYQSRNNVVVTQNRFNELADAYINLLEAETTVSSWATTAWNNCTAKGLLDGTMPQGFSTREQLATVLNKIVN